MVVGGVVVRNTLSTLLSDKLSRVRSYLVVGQLPLTPEPPDFHETVALVPSELTAAWRLMGLLGLGLGVAVGVALGVGVALAAGSGVLVTVGVAVGVGVADPKTVDGVAVKLKLARVGDHVLHTVPYAPTCTM